MKRIPEFRIVGSASTEKKAEVKKDLERNFSDQLASLTEVDREKLEQLEYPKSEQELALIAFANEETNRLMQEAGVEPYDIPTENYHIVPPEIYKKSAAGTGTASTFFKQQMIIFNAENYRSNPVYFGASALHETLHLKGHTAFEVEAEGEKIEKTLYRAGVEVLALQQLNSERKYHRHFFGLHEAIVANQEKKSLPKLFELPELKESKIWLMSDEAQELRKKLALKKEIPENEIFWVDQRGKDDWERFSYYQQCRVLDYVCAEIQKQLPEKYQSADRVFKEFLKAHFTGHLMSIARLVEKTFGEGSFRLLGNMSADDVSGNLSLEALQKMRQKFIRDNQLK